MRMVDLILRKRDGGKLSQQEIEWFVHGYVRGDIPDYQVSAMLMAIFFRGMDDAETVDLVNAMVSSGDVIDLGGIRGIKVDKHSTGGVGDKTSIVLGPMVAALGVPVAKMSGRGLGHTGGTLDKLEAFHGFQVELPMERFISQVNAVGLAICGQTGNLVPGDKMLYALRDVTGTVENLSLIAGSIMSKKIAAGADAIVLDVKMGAGAFMKSQEDAFALGQKMVDIGKLMGRQTVAVVSSMEQPLGNTIGNAIELKEAIQTLRGHGPKDLMEVCLALGAEMAVLGGKANDKADALTKLNDAIQNGSALRKLREMVESQGGDPNLVDNPDLLPNGAHKAELRAPKSGYVSGLDAMKVGHAAMLLGAGRETKTSPIDLGAGINLQAKVGTAVQAGDVLATLETNNASSLPSAMDALLHGYTFSDVPVDPAQLIVGKIV